jgi:dTDP-4-dehydrorhamnose reductase
MRILVTGAHGQVGTELMRLGTAAGHAMHGSDHADIDICDAAAVQQAIDRLAPDAVINAAAYTAVDKAESDQDTAFAVNRDGPRNLALACEAASIPLVHISTDYVFDGSKTGAWNESDAPHPLGIYGASKLAGEEAVQSLCTRHLILRTSWVFSAHGHNFVKTMLRLASEREELGVVADQSGKPTSAAEIARICLATLEQGDGRWGLYHLAQPDATTWHDFAEVIFAEARRQGMALKLASLRAIATSDYPTPATRPANSVLDCGKLESTFDLRLRPWRESLAEVVAELIAKRDA